MKRIKKAMRRVVARSRFLSVLVERIRLSFSMWAAGSDIGKKEYRHLRARFLRHRIEQLRKSIQRVDYGQGILVFKDNAYSFAEGILLDLRGTNRYLKVPGDEPGNEGKEMADFLDRMGIGVETVVDLGANFGEISLYFKRRYPSAHILAVEASPDNFLFLQSNCVFQLFPTDNLTLLNEAVSDRKGFVDITAGVSQENILIHSDIHLKTGDEGSSTGATHTVPADTLLSLLSRFHFTKVDFLKIDIEGSEPLLYESLEVTLEQIRCILIEVGDKADHKAYFPLLMLLWNYYGSAFNRENEKRFESFEELKNAVLTSYAADVWFVKELKR